MKKILDIKDLCFVADKQIILKDINWSVNEGERWVLLGANGSGKTSLLSTICAYNTPSSGSMTVAGKTYSEYEWQKVRERIAIVSAHLNRQINAEELALETVVSGEFAMLNLWGDVSKGVCDKAVSKLRDFKIEHLAASKWGTLSQGERQKVLIARAMMVNPYVVFLDEPCNGLDPIARKEFVGFMNEISLSKKIPAMVLATHHIEEIPPSFTHALVLKDGAVLASGEIGGIINSQILTEAYGAKVKVFKKAGKFFLKI